VIVDPSESPILFLAKTVKVYGIPYVNPVIFIVVNVVVDVVVVIPFVLETVYPVITEPPFDGTFHERRTEKSLATPVTVGLTGTVGLPGTVASVTGITGDDVIELEELPEAFMAETVNVTSIPLANVFSVANRTLPTVIGLPTDGVTMYPVIGEVPIEAGAVQETVVELIATTAETPVGAPGSDADGVTGNKEEANELPAAFIAETVNVTSVPLVNPFIVTDKTLPTVTGLPTDGVIMYPVIAEPPFEAGGIQETVADALPR
jgi:hypothetical protein